MKSLRGYGWAGIVVSAVLSVAASAAASAQTGAASGAGSPLPPETLAIVNGVSIPVAQLNAAVQASGQPDTPALRQAIRQQLVVRELFRQKAEEAHYDVRPEVIAAVESARINTEAQLYVKDHVHPQAVTDVQVRARYDEIVRSLGSEEYKARLIAVNDTATATRVLDELKAGRSFDQLAQQYSIAPSKVAGGELPWVSFKTPVKQGQTEGLPLSVAQAMTQLTPGAVTTEPLAVDGVQVLLQLEARRPTQPPPFDQVKEAIRQQLQAQELQKASSRFAEEMLDSAAVRQ